MATFHACILKNTISQGNIEYTNYVFAYLAGTSTPEINTCSKANT